MHGRIRIKTTAQKAEEERLRMAAKVKKLKFAMSIVFEKVSSEHYDELGMKTTAKVLAHNSDFYSFWNYRRRYFDRLKKSESCDEKQFEQELMNELEFTTERLLQNPKSYPTWHHRCFICSLFTECNWQKELDLCDQYLSKDERNFHCWDYRRFVTSHMSDSNLKSNELQKTLELISENFSNYSSWHYRSKLLQDDIKNEEVMQAEFDNVQNAYFVDPSDQAAWIYHTWLVNNKLKFKNVLLGVNTMEGKVYFTLSEKLTSKNITEFVFLGDDDKLDVNFDNIKKINAFNKHFLYAIDQNMFSSNKKCSICYKNERSISLNLQFNIWNIYMQNNEVNEASKEFLLEQVELLEELLEENPNHKRVMLNLVNVLQKLEPKSKRVGELIQSLGEVDSKRINYYNDQYSKYNIELRLGSISKDCEAFSLQSCSITNLFHGNLMINIVHLDVSNNKLKELNEKFSVLSNMKTIEASDNLITCVRGLYCLTGLTSVNLCRNLISDKSKILKLKQTCPGLEVLNYTENPLN